MNTNGKFFNESKSNLYITNEPYILAYKRVKRIKGFYTHLLVYVLVNSFLIVQIYNYSQNSTFWSWKTFSTAFFWGIGLGSHWISVFGRNIFFSKDWENKKIQEFIDKEKKEKLE